MKKKAKKLIGKPIKKSKRRQTKAADVRKLMDELGVTARGAAWLCSTTERTVHRWLTGAVSPPGSALTLLAVVVVESLKLGVARAIEKVSGMAPPAGVLK
jgi:DNA-binding transcriptional regulator YiaG